MKKYILLLPVLLLPFLVKAQKFHSGLRLGLNASQINGDHMAGFNKIGPVAGLYVSYVFNERWQGMFEMLYSQKGSKESINDSLGAMGPWYLLRLNYIEVPVMAVYTPTEKFSIMGGLGGAYLFGTHWEDVSGTVMEESFMKKLELSATIGAAYRFSDRLSVYARYTNSLLPVGKGNSAIANITYGAGLTNLVASFGLYYHFLKQAD